MLNAENETDKYEYFSSMLQTSFHTNNLKRQKLGIISKKKKNPSFELRQVIRAK